MSVIAAALRELMAAGLAGEPLVEAIGRIEESLPKDIDIQAERRRERDRIRKANLRKSTESTVISADSAETAETPSSSPSSVPPSPITPSSLPPSTPPTTGSLRSLAQIGRETSTWPADYRQQFWNKYPRKKAKRAAFKVLDRIKAAGEATFEQIMAGIEKIPLGEPVFIKHPATWLNGACWDDEILPGEQNGHRGSRPLQDDSKSISRAAGRLAEAARRGEFTFGPRPSLLPGQDDDPVLLLPKR
jgi:hypothetical protein